MSSNLNEELIEAVRNTPQLWVNGLEDLTAENLPLWDAVVLRMNSSLTAIAAFIRFHRLAGRFMVLYHLGQGRECTGPVEWHLFETLRFLSVLCSTPVPDEELNTISHTSSVP